MERPGVFKLHFFTVLAEGGDELVNAIAGHYTAEEIDHPGNGWRLIISRKKITFVGYIQKGKETADEVGGPMEGERLTIIHTDEKKHIHREKHIKRKA